MPERPSIDLDALHDYLSLNYIPGLTDEHGRSFGIFALDIFDDLLHVASASWAAAAAWTSHRASKLFLRYFGLVQRGISWLGDPILAMISIIVVNAWRGIPFFAISLLAGLQTISQELYEAAAIDGANAVQRFRYITLPMVKPVLLVVLLFSIIWTFADFQLVYVLTRGGPANSTHLFATLAYQVGVVSGSLGEGAAISLTMFPILVVVVVILLMYLRKE